MLAGVDVVTILGSEAGVVEWPRQRTKNNSETYLNTGPH